MSKTATARVLCLRDWNSRQCRFLVCSVPYKWPNRQKRCIPHVCRCSVFYNYMYVPHAFLPPRFSCGSSELPLMPHVCHQCGQGFASLQALVGHQSTRWGGKDKIGEHSSEATPLTVAPLCHNHNTKNREFDWLVDVYADQNNQRLKTIASDASIVVASEQPEHSISTVDCLRKMEERKYISSSRGDTGKDLSSLPRQVVKFQNSTSVNTELTLSSARPPRFVRSAVQFRSMTSVDTELSLSSVA